jgi:hypothetical protein
VTCDILPSRDKIERFIVSMIKRLGCVLFVKAKGPMKSLSHIFLDCHLAIFLGEAPPSLSLLAFSSKPISDWMMAFLSPVAALGIPKVDVRKFELVTTTS